MPEDSRQYFASNLYSNHSEQRHVLRKICVANVLPIEDTNLSSAYTIENDSLPVELDPMFLSINAIT